MAGAQVCTTQNRGLRVGHAFRGACRLTCAMYARIICSQLYGPSTRTPSPPAAPAAAARASGPSESRNHHSELKACCPWSPWNSLRGHWRGCGRGPLSDDYSAREVKACWPWFPRTACEGIGEGVGEGNCHTTVDQGQSQGAKGCAARGNLGTACEDGDQGKRLTKP